MAAPDWDAVTAAITKAPAIRWRGRAWRVHRHRYEATSHRGSELVSGRFHRAPDRFPPERCFPALYLSLSPEVCIAELLRHTSPLNMDHIRESRLSELRVRLNAVLDARDLDALGLTHEILLKPHEHEAGQRLGETTMRCGYEGLLVPSATRLGDNLIVLPNARKETSQLDAIGYRDLQEVYYIDS